MENEKRKNITPNIDEDLMMSIMEDGVKKEGLEIPPNPPTEPDHKKPISREPSRIKKTNNVDYEDIFFNKPETNARDGKTVYIRPDFHEKLSRIVQVIGEDKITIYAYLDNVLDYHFQEFGKQITTSFNNKYKPIL
jgi:hypothetical protein